MGIELFAAVIGLGLYASRMIGELTPGKMVRPIPTCLGLLLACLIHIAFLPQITTALLRLTRY